MNQAYEAGTYIRYGNTGVCRIENIAEVPYPGPQPTRLCYILKPLRNSGVEVSVPLDNEGLCAKMQPLRSREEIDALLEEVATGEKLAWNSERKLRSLEFRKIQAQGDAKVLLQLLCCLQLQRRKLAMFGKRLSAMDDTVRRNVSRILCEEFSFSLGMTPEQAEVYITHRLNEKHESK
ncbi:MAG: CarD family transcriptional regulator [Oscillospiraceae bacterium]|nr:CarD family transcriptional regulator [Oscillospiraceae bacterium]